MRGEACVLPGSRRIRCGWLLSACSITTRTGSPRTHPRYRRVRRPCRGLLARAHTCDPTRCCPGSSPSTSTAASSARPNPTLKSAEFCQLIDAGQAHGVWVALPASSACGRGKGLAMKRSILLVAAVLLVGTLATPAGASGSGWSITPSPNPRVPTGQLFWESCTGATSCTAVGTYVKASGVGVTLAERWNGSTWRIQPTPNPRGAAVSSLFGVSCTAPSACTAVGASITRAGESQPLAERWDGSRWRIQPTPSPAQGGGSLNGVACTSPSACTAVGGSNAGTLAEVWDGTRWRIQPTPNPAGAQFAFLNTVACPSASACTAAGAYRNSSGTFQTLAERWDGSRWRIQPTPSRAGGDNLLIGVDCTAASACTAAGFSVGRSGILRTLAERWDGSRWRIQPTPNPRGAAPSQFASVSCTSAVACAAVGARTDSSGDFTRTLAERWDGSRWRLQPTPNPPGAQGSALFGLSCTSSSACTATGNSFNSSGTPVGVFAERWNGTKWRIQPVPAPSSPGGFLSGVACTSPSVCTAVGARTDASGNPIGTLAERWNGTRWRIQRTPNPAAGAGLSAVSCTSSSACTAVGGSEAGTLAERWDGTAWRIQPTPKLSGAENFFNGVACKAHACTAVGLHLTDSGPFTLAERWDGTSWHIQPTPKIPGAYDIDPPAVACPTSSSCTAAGSYTNNGPRVTLAEQWNGAGNSTQPTAGRSVAPGSPLSACAPALLLMPPSAGGRPRVSPWHWSRAKTFSTPASAAWSTRLAWCRAG